MANIMRLGGGSGGGKPKKLLSSLTEGSLVSVLENGKLTPFYVAKHNYEADLNGEGRTLLMRKTSYDSRAVNSSNANAFATSTLYAWMNGEYKSMLSGTVQGEIGTTSYPNTESGGKAAITGRGAVFLASLTEFGLKDGSGSPVEGTTLPLANQLYICYDTSGNAVSQWTRTPVENDTQRVYYASSVGTAGAVTATSSLAVRPCFTLPDTMALRETPYDDGSWGLIDEYEPTDTVDITENGIHNVKEYSFANVNVAPVLLWTNASPTSAFTPQTLTFDESGFSGYLVEIRYSTSVDTRWVGFIPIGTTMGVDKGVYGYAGTSYVSRYCGQGTGNSITINEGKIGTSRNDVYAVPTRIWGVKFTL